MKHMRKNIHIVMKKNNEMKKQLLFSFFIVLSLTTYTQERILWDYPIKPGTSEWAALETNEQMTNACQIPLEILSTITTKELVEISLNYPQFNNYIAFNDEREGVNNIIKRFNGLQELSQRTDCINELIIAYENYPIITQIQTEPNSESYHTPYKLPFLELVLSDNLFLSQLNSEDLETIRKIAINKYALKLENHEVYSFFNIKTTMLLAAIIIDKQNNTTNSQEERYIIKSFIKDYNLLQPDLLTKVSKIIIK